MHSPATPSIPVAGHGARAGVAARWPDARLVAAALALATMAPVAGAAGQAGAAGRLDAATAAAIRASASGPAVIAHRGASALRPEHTLEAYARAIADGADFVEPDLVMTRDGVLVARHENEIGGTTDVASHARFAARRIVRDVDGQQVDGWFVEDFTLDELRTLRARERLPELRGTAYDGRFGVPTFDEIVAAVADASARQGRRIGLVPELKHSSHFHARGLDPEAALMQALQRHAYTRQAPVGVQSFEVGNLRRLRGLVDAAGMRNVFLVQLLGAPEASPRDRVLAGQPQSYLEMAGGPGLADIAGYADVLAPHLRYVVPVDAAGGLAAPTPLVAAAHAAGLPVHVWTLRPENHFLPPALRCGSDPAQRCGAGARAEAQALAEAGVDGLFGDDPAMLRQALDVRRPD